MRPPLHPPSAIPKTEDEEVNQELIAIRLFGCDGGDGGDYSGCPQGIAKRGNYGSFLQDDWDTIYKMSEFAPLLALLSR